MTATALDFDLHPSMKREAATSARSRRLLKEPRHLPSRREFHSPGPARTGSHPHQTTGEDAPLPGRCALGGVSQRYGEPSDTDYRVTWHGRTAALGVRAVDVRDWLWTLDGGRQDVAAQCRRGSEHRGQELLGLVLAVVGLVVVFDFGGFTTWYVNLIFRLMRPVERVLQHVPPWRRILRTPVETRLRWQVILFRVIGAGFAAAGIGAIIPGLA